MVESLATRTTTISFERYDGNRKDRKTLEQFANNGEGPTTKMFTTSAPTRARNCGQYLRCRELCH